MYLATNKAGSKENIDTLKRDVEWNKQHGHRNTFKELELLRQQKIGGEVDAVAYEREVERVMNEARERWKNSSEKESQVERQQAEEQFQKIQKQIAANKSNRFQGESNL